MKARKLIDYVLITLKGMAMGAADAVPGVSGGTIALVSGIYEELVQTIGNINLGLIKLLFQGKFKEFWSKANGNFILALGAGVLISYVSFMKLAKYLLEHHPILIWSFFLGLIVASIWYLGKQIPKWNLAMILFLILGIGLGYYLTTLPSAEVNDNQVYFFVCAAIAICAMILPGISGTFILILLGAYTTLSTAIADVDVKKLLVFVSGAVIGLLSFSKVLKWLLSKYKFQTFAVLTGLIVGSINQVWPWKKVLETKTFGDKTVVVDDVNVWPSAFEGNSQLLPAIILAIVGFSLIFILERTASKK
ncbi:DUF368 domain-containing protein [Flagellimonas algicola]|uniref:DUF368 domain-containing protein n=1 Tax=Flagellimonas algicola TaxID=2583815 RepID=A0ABY2WQW9_9FLAO|nr:DUF368 domain-containing protein [Allomuricauda algicola]TMU57140.1 DUF368 domain-containing protein [Allomuricauda algicola]